MVLLNKNEAFTQGHTATLLLNENDQGMMLSFYPDNYDEVKVPTVAGGEMRIAMLDSGQWNDLLYGSGDVTLVSSNGYIRTENYTDNLYLTVSNADGRSGLGKMANLFANPGTFRTLSNNCDYQTAAIVRAAGKKYDQKTSPRDSFIYTSAYHTNRKLWLLMTFMPQ